MPSAMYLTISQQMDNTSMLTVWIFTSMCNLFGCNRKHFV